MDFLKNLNFKDEPSSYFYCGIFIITTGFSAKLLKSGMDILLIKSFIGLGFGLLVIGFSIGSAYKESVHKEPATYQTAGAYVTSKHIEHDLFSKSLLYIGRGVSFCFFVKIIYLLIF